MASERMKSSAGIAELERVCEELQSRIRRLEISERRLAALNDISAVITRPLEIDRVLGIVTDRIAGVMGVEAVLAFLVTEDSAGLELMAHRGVSQEFAEKLRRMRVGDCYNGQVVASGQAMVIEDGNCVGAATQEVVRREGLRAQLIVPVRFEERVIGTLCVGTRRPRRFQSEDIELLSSIGNQIGVSIENARLYRQQRETAAQLQASEKRYRTLFESANDAIWVHDMAGTILAVNRACAELTDYSVEELSGMNVRSFLRDGGLALARQVRARLLRGEALDGPYEQVLIRKDGTEAVLRLSTSLVTGEGRPTAFQHIARDVTEDKRIQRNLISHLQQVVKAQEEERKRIARELHDDTAQILGSLSREVDNFVRKKTYLLPDEVAFLKYLREQLNRGLQEVHRFSQDLRPSVLDDLGLPPALKSLVAKMNERSGIDVELKVVGRQRRFAPEVELLVFRIVQEALNNVKRHSHASKACVGMAFAEGRTRLTISDNGQGFELPRRTDDFLQCGKLGLAGMQERARLLGGTVEVHSAPGDGTTIILEIPE